MLALLAPTVNSYARYWDVGQFAPAVINWGFDNRTCAVRVSRQRRLEYKLPDASVNPYLSHAAVLEAIADGLEQGIDPGAAAGRETPTARPAAASARCRGRSATRSRRSRRTTSSAARLPPSCYDAFVEYKTDEWERFCGTVTEWHREMYLRALP